MRSSVTALREQIEDPERMLHQLIIDMRNELDSVRNAVAEAVADELQMRKRLLREREEEQKWRERAEVAIRRGDSEAAKTALSQRLQTEERIETHETNLAKQTLEVNKLKNAVRDLEDKIRQADQKKNLLVARMTRAKTTTKVNTVLDRAGQQSAFAQMERLESKVEREESMVEAWEQMDGTNLALSDIERDFLKQERDAKLQQELEKLQASVEEKQNG